MADQPADSLPAALDAVAADLVGDFYPTSAVGEVAAEIEMLAVGIEDEVANGWGAWAAVAVLAVVSAEIARREVRGKAARRNPDLERRGEGYGP